LYLASLSFINRDSRTGPVIRIIERMKISNYYATHEEKLFSGEKQKITYSFNEKEQTIIGVVEEKGDFIYLYEYRGRFVGFEFFISFSKQSNTYKLIDVSDMQG
jgi:hypothetical protein